MKTFVIKKCIFECQKKFSKNKNILTQHDVEKKQLKEENEKLRKEENEKLRKEESEKLRNEKENENEQLTKNNIVKDVNIKESTQKPMKSLKEDNNTTDSYPN